MPATATLAQLADIDHAINGLGEVGGEWVRDRWNQRASVEVSDMNDSIFVNERYRYTQYPHYGTSPVPQEIQALHHPTGQHRYKYSARKFPEYSIASHSQHRQTLLGFRPANRRMSRLHLDEGPNLYLSNKAESYLHSLSVQVLTFRVQVAKSDNPTWYPMAIEMAESIKICIWIHSAPLAHLIGYYSLVSVCSFPCSPRPVRLLI